MNRDRYSKSKSGNVAHHNKSSNISKSNQVKSNEASMHIKFEEDEPKIQKTSTSNKEKATSKHQSNNKEKVNKQKNKIENKIKSKVSVDNDEDDDKVLLQEITALGGTKEDFEWINKIDTDEEEIEDKVDKNTKVDDKKLQEQLSKFIKGLGISKIKIEELDEEEEELEELSKDTIESKWEDIIDQSESEQEDIEIPDLVEEKQVNENEETDFVEESQLSNLDQERTFSSNNKLKVDQRLNKPIKKKLFDANSLWYENEVEILEEGPNFDNNFANELMEVAKNLLQQENELSEKGYNNKSDQNFMSNIMQSGTLSDKISALTLQIQESPMHHLKEFSKLLMMMRRNNRRESMLCLNSFKDLCLSCLLPTDRKLKYFVDQPLSAKNVTQNHLILWYFEDYLKKAYFDFLLIAEQRSHDPLLHSKQTMVNYFYELLKDKPEQEANLLTLLVNKLGDKENKIASKASYLLLQILEQHPGMKQIIANEIEKLLFRPNISLRAQYYSVITLNQFILSTEDIELSNFLMEVYFSLFKIILIYKKQDNNIKDVKIKKNRKRDQKNNSKNKVQIKESSASSEDSEKVKLIAGILTGVNRAFPYSKIESEKLKQHINTLFFICKSFNFNAAIQSLNLLNQISLQQPLYRTRYLKSLYETLLDHRLIYSSKQAMYLNLIFKTLKQENSINIIMSFVKRMLQIAVWHHPPFVNGLLFLIFKLSKIHLVINAAIEQPEDSLELNNNKDKEEDTKDEDDDNDINNKDEEIKSEDKQEENKEVINSLMYRGRYDDPNKSYAEYTCLWELGLLKHHFHPSVNHHINQLLTLKDIEEQSMLHLHTLQHFLDIFAYKNPKKLNEDKINSVMQANIKSSGIVWNKNNNVNLNELVNSKDFKNKSKEDVNVEYQFFHKFFNLKTNKNNKKKSKVIDEEDEEDDEDQIWKAMQHSSTAAFEDDEDDEDDVDEDLDLGDISFSDEEGDLDGSDGSNDSDLEEGNGFENQSLSDDEVDDSDLVETKDAISFDDLIKDNKLGEEQDDEISEEDEENSDIHFNMEDSDEEEEESEQESIEEKVLTKKNKSKENNKRKVEQVNKVGPNNERNRKSREQRKKLKALPTFASIDDYEHLLNRED